MVIVRNFIWSIILFKSRASQGRKFYRFSVLNTMKIFALGYVMEGRTISKGEREREFLGIKENKSCILPHGSVWLPWGFTVHDNKVLTT